MPPPLAQQKRVIKILIPVLVGGALVVVLFATRLPLPLRLVTASIDVAAAAALWLLLRQKFGGW